MENKKTEIVFIIDKSGSMSCLVDDTIGGYNHMLSEQRKEEGECLITTVLFDNRVSLLHDKADIKDVKDITRKEYRPGGCTALLDAIGFAISRERDECEERKLMYVIITDGKENASREYSLSLIKSMIECESEKGSEFIFLGANMDAVEEAERIGIRANRAVDYLADGDGTRLSYAMMSNEISHYRRCGIVSEENLERIREDRRKRG